MRALDLIRSRRSVRDFEPRPLPGGALSRCLEAAVWAPNRGLTQPWRFVVVGPRGRAALADRAQTLEDLQAEDGGQFAPWLSAVRPLRRCAEAVAVLQWLDPRPEVRSDDRLALGAAVQNMLLCAWDEGFGGLWLGGPLLGDAEARRVLGARSDEEAVALVALGYPESVPPVPRRLRAAELTRRVE